MINKILVNSLILQVFLIHILVLNLYAEELLEKGPSDRSNVESQAPISVQTLKVSYSFIKSYQPIFELQFECT